MRLTIIVRMVIGYLAIFIPVVAVSAYAFSQLSLFHKVTDGILQIDNHMRELGQELGDSILAQTRYERKYVITKDKELYNQFMLAERDVSKRIDEAISMADTAHKEENLTRIKNDDERYKSTFHKEKRMSYFLSPSGSPWLFSSSLLTRLN